jgi:superfamily II DNA or RNA helicase
VSEVHLSPRNLEATFGSATLENGRRYHLEGRVLEASVESAALVRGRVQGTQSEPYDVEVNLREERFGVEVDAHCSCSSAVNCKHAAALLCHTIDGRSSADADADRESIDVTVHAWLDELDTLVSEVAPAVVDNPSNAKLIYVLIAGRDADAEVPHAKTFRTNDSGRNTPYDPADVLQAEPVVDLTSGDRDLLYELADLGYRPQQGLSLDGMLGSTLLARMVDTGRCKLNTPDGCVLRSGSSRKLALDWTLDPDTGQFTVSLQTDPPALCVLPFTPPWYVDSASGECGPVATSLPRAVGEELTGAPVLDAASASAVVSRLGKLLAPFDLKVDAPPRVTELEATDMRAVLTFQGEGDCAASLHFDYAGYHIDPIQVSDRVVIRSEDEFVVVPRDRAREQAAARMLATLGLALDDPDAVDSGASVWKPQCEDGWPDFLVDAVPLLEEEGWGIYYDPSFSLEVLDANAWGVLVSQLGSKDVYEIALEIEGAPHASGLLPAVAAHLAKSPKAGVDERRRSQVALQLDDGLIVGVPSARVEIVAQVLSNLAAPLGPIAGGKALRVPRFQSALLLDLDAPQHGLRYRGDPHFLDLGRRIASFNGIRELPEPPGLGVSLRGYQRQALGWLNFLSDIDSGGCLADDMGLGKTVQMLAHLLAQKLGGQADRPSLVVAPTSVLGNWVREAARVTPQLKVLLLHGPRRHADFDLIPQHDLCITSYALLPRDEELLSNTPFHLVILDEAQHIKNPRTRAAVVAKRISARRTLALTGTPMENHLGELWALFSVLVPGLLGSEEEFRRVFRRPIERDGNEETTHSLARRLAPFMLRRTKAAVAPELPPRTEMVHTVTLGSRQSGVYERVREEMEARLRNVLHQGSVEDARVEILSALLRLRQVCCDPRLIGEDTDISSSAKLDLLMELVPTLIEEGRRILIFSQFTSMLAIIERSLKDAGIEYLKLTGESRDRQGLVDRFQTGEIPVFLISLKAGGTGLNLTAADTVIHYDPWWNPAAQAQASDRAHRIGQTQPVFIHKLLSEGTVEERIFALQANKQRLADGLFLGRSESGLEWTAEQLQALLAPVG